MAVSRRTLTPVVACTLGSEDLATQAGRWARLRREAGLERVEADDGLRLVFRAERAVEEELRALVAVENDCCAWADWDVRREGGKLVMHASSTGKGVATLHMMFSSERAVVIAAGLGRDDALDDPVPADQQKLPERFV